MTTTTLPRLLSLAALLAASCAATAPSRPSHPDAQPEAHPEDARCVVAVDPQIRMVAFAPPSGLDAGVTSMFFVSTPQVKVGDLVRLKSGDAGGPRVEVLEAQAPACTEVAQAVAAHHHAQH